MAVNIAYFLVPALFMVTAKADSPESCRFMTAQLSDNWTLPSEGNECVVDAQYAWSGDFAHHALVVCDDCTICSGSLISETIVLTSAACTVGYKKWTIHLGDIRGTQDEYDSVWVVESRWADQHPEYSSEPGHRSNDVAVIILPREAPLYGYYIDLVALPSLLEINKTFTGKSALVSGFGRISDEPPPEESINCDEYTHQCKPVRHLASDCSELLRWAEVTVLPNEICSQFYKPGVVTESTLCAGNTDPAFGDQGSPLVVWTPGGYQQIGVGSFWGGVCDAAVPAGYTRVTAVLDWITTTVRRHSQRPA